MNTGRGLIRRKTRAWIVLFVVLFGTGCATTPMTTTRQHPELEQKLSRLKTVVILPIEVGLLRKTAFGGDELQPGRERELQSQISRDLHTILSTRNYTVVLAGNGDEPDTVMTANPELRELRAGMAALASETATAVPVGEAAEMRTTLGPVVQKLATQYKADALLYARYAGYEKSGGRKAVEIIRTALLAGIVAGATRTNNSGIEPPAGAEGEVSLVFIEGTDGEVLWSNRLAGRTDRKRGQTGRSGYYGITDLVQRAVAPIPSRPSAQ